MPLNSGEFLIEFAMARKVAGFERAVLWNSSQSCLSMRPSRTIIEFIVASSVEIIVSSDMKCSLEVLRLVTHAKVMTGSDWLGISWAKHEKVGRVFLSIIELYYHLMKSL